MPQGKLAEDTHRQVQGNCHDHIGADGNQLAVQGGGNIVRQDHGLHDQEGDDHDAEGCHAVAPCGQKLFDLFHNCSPSRPLYFFIDTFAEQSVRLHQEHHDQHGEHDGVG